MTPLSHSRFTRFPLLFTVYRRRQEARVEVRQDLEAGGVSCVKCQKGSRSTYQISEIVAALSCHQTVRETEANHVLHVGV